MSKDIPPSVPYDDGLKERLKDPEYAWALHQEMAKQLGELEAERAIWGNEFAAVCAMKEQLRDSTERVSRISDAIAEKMKRSHYSWSAGGDYQNMDWRNEGSINCATDLFEVLQHPRQETELRTDKCPRCNGWHQCQFPKQAQQEVRVCKKHGWDGPGACEPCQFQQDSNEIKDSENNSEPAPIISDKQSVQAPRVRVYKQPRHIAILGVECSKCGHEERVENVTVVETTAQDSNGVELGAWAIPAKPSKSDG